MADYYTFSGNVYDSSAAGTATFALTSSAGNPISYLQRSHIHVYLSDDDGDTWVEQARPAAWEFDAAATSIVLVTGITAGQWVRVLRITPIDARYVDFEDGTLLTAGQLDQGEDFSRFCDQEQRDALDIAVAGAVIFKGTIDLTADNAPANPKTGWSFFNSGDGTVIQGGTPGWNGIIGDAVEGGERVIYDGAQWDLIETPSGQVGVIEVTATAPITADVTDPQRPDIGITAATQAAAGSMSAADKTKLDGITAGAAVTKITAGTNVTIDPAGGTGDVTINATGGEIFVQDEGTQLATSATTLNFTGAGVTATGTGATKEINVPVQPGGTTTGGSTDLVFQENTMVCTANYTLTAGRSALSAGPITINNSVVIQIPNNQSWVIL